jgi:hypothetical protein
MPRGPVCTEETGGARFLEPAIKRKGFKNAVIKLGRPQD